MVIRRNDELTLRDVERLAPDQLLISPGPCTPREAGISTEIIRTYGPRIPTLGVCLGHQCLAEAFGGTIVRAERLMHGKTSAIHHHQRDVFDGLPTPLTATRYHSLVVERSSLPACFEITAETKPQGEIMGLRHRRFPVWGVQFHPESVLTEHGKQLLQNFMDLSSG